MDAADVSQVLSVAESATAYDGVAPLDEAAVLALRNRPADVITVLTGRYGPVWASDGAGTSRPVSDDDPVGFATMIGNELAVVVRPEARGRGLGTALVSAALAETGRESRTTTAWMHGDSPAARSLAARFGFVAERELWVMRRARGDLSTLQRRPLDAAQVTLRGFEAGDEEEIVRVNAAAFSWHPEQGSMDLANLRERMASEWFEPAGLIEAWEGDRLLGFHWTKRHSDRLGEVYVVAVDPEAQGRGLGRLLTVAGLEHMKELDEVHLYVESDNVAAVRLYESLGFTHSPVDTHVQFERS